MITLLSAGAHQLADTHPTCHTKGAAFATLQHSWSPEGDFLTSRMPNSKRQATICYNACMVIYCCNRHAGSSLFAQ